MSDLLWTSFFQILDLVRKKLDILDLTSQTKIINLVSQVVQTDPNRLARIQDIPTFIKPLELARMLQSADYHDKQMANKLIENVLAYDKKLTTSDLIDSYDLRTKDILASIKEQNLSERISALE